MKEVFACFDKDSSGSVTTAELGHVLKSMNKHYNDVELKRIVGKFDVNGDGQIDFDEFLMMMTKTEKKEQDEDRAVGYREEAGYAQTHDETSGAAVAEWTEEQTASGYQQESWNPDQAAPTTHTTTTAGSGGGGPWAPAQTAPQSWGGGEEDE